MPLTPLTSEICIRLINNNFLGCAVIGALDDDATVVYTSSDGDTVEGSIVAMQSAGIISETTVSAYVEFYSQTIGGKVQ